MAQATLKVHGLRELHKALKAVDADLSKQLDRELIDAGRIVQTTAAGIFSSVDPGSALGFKAKARGFGRVVVQQSRRKTTGRRGDYGSLQMRKALLPALDEKQGDVEAAIEGMLDRLGRSHGF